MIFSCKLLIEASFSWDAWLDLIIQNYFIFDSFPVKMFLLVEALVVWLCEVYDRYWRTESWQKPQPSLLSNLCLNYEFFSLFHSFHLHTISHFKWKIYYFFNYSHQKENLLIVVRSTALHRSWFCCWFSSNSRFSPSKWNPVRKLIQPLWVTNFSTLKLLVMSIHCD